MKTFIKKLTSRKFIISAVVVISGIAAALQTASNTTVKIVGIAAAGACAIAYGIIEGTIDKASVQSAIETVITAVENSEGDDDNEK